MNINGNLYWKYRNRLNNTCIYTTHLFSACWRYSLEPRSIIARICSVSTLLCDDGSLKRHVQRVDVCSMFGPSGKRLNQ